MTVIPFEIYRFLSTIISLASMVNYFVGFLKLPVPDNRIPSGYRDRKGRFVSKKSGDLAILGFFIGTITFIANLAGYSLQSEIVGFISSLAIGGPADIIISVMSLLLTATKQN